MRILGNVFLFTFVYFSEYRTGTKNVLEYMFGMQSYIGNIMLMINRRDKFTSRWSMSFRKVADGKHDIGCDFIGTTLCSVMT